jgi:glucosamine-phosphate N-acetyltransferase
MTTPCNLPRRLFINRPITSSDYSYELMMLLNTLSPTIPIEERPESIDGYRLVFESFLAYLESNPLHKVFVLYCNETKRVVGLGTILFEKKMIHNFGTVAHIEDIVISADYQNQGLGKRIIRNLIYEAKKEKCYKIILNCTPELKAFYEKCGFEEKNTQMAIYLENETEPI